MPFVTLLLLGNVIIQKGKKIKKLYDHPSSVLVS